MTGRGQGGELQWPSSEKNVTGESGIVERGSEREAADTRVTWDATSAWSLVAKPSGLSGMVPLSLVEVYGGFLPAQGMGGEQGCDVHGPCSSPTGQPGTPTDPSWALRISLAVPGGDGLGQSEGQEIRHLSTELRTQGMMSSQPEMTLESGAGKAKLRRWL